LFATEITIVSNSTQAGIFPCSAPNSQPPAAEQQNCQFPHSSSSAEAEGKFPGNGAEVGGQGIGGVPG